MADQLATAVRRFRLRAELTQEALADRSGVSVRTIRSLETGERSNPRLALVRRLADTLSLSPSEHEELVAAIVGVPRSEAVTPRQLPASPGHFTGRTRELSELSVLLDTESSRVACVIGSGGIGKTSLALRWAHQHLDRFPDGQLFVNLRGFDPSATPMPPDIALRGFLHALGVAPAAIPAELDALVGLYRSVVAGKRLLIVADNAADAVQVAPLLPGNSACAVLITGRTWLSGLITAHGAHPVTVEAFPEPETRAMLAGRLGADRLAAEPEATDELVAFCAGLPLALSILVGRALTHARTGLADLAVELRDYGLSALDEGDPAASLPAVLSASYRALTERQARVLDLLSIAPGPDISLPSAANLIGISRAATHVELRALRRASLLSQDTTGRWRMHDLIRHHAADHADRTLSETDRDTALGRLVDFYLHTAYHGDQLLDPCRPPIQLAPPVAGCVPYPLSDGPAAMAWFDAEHVCLLFAQQEAAARGWHDAVWQLAWAMNRFHYRRAHLRDDLAVWQAALAATEHLDDPAAHVAAHRFLGTALRQVGRSDEGLEHLHEALDRADGAGDRLAQAGIHHALSGLWGARGEDHLALDHATRALRHYEALDAPKWEADALNSVGWLAARVGQYDRARAHCAASLDLHRQHHDDNSVAITLDSLGYIDHHTGRHAAAIAHYEQAVRLLRALGDHYQLADTLDASSHPYLALGRHADAEAAWREALELYQTQRRTADADRVQRHLNERSIVDEGDRNDTS